MSDEIPFNISSHIPPDQLRAVADDPVEMARAVEWISQQASAVDDVMERARLLSYGGVCAGILGDYDTGRAMLNEAVAIADAESDDRSQVVFRIRLADVVSGAGEPGSAVELLRGLLERFEEDEQFSSLRDFVNQHLGKALLEAGEIESGLTHLERARELRLQKGEPELLASTDQALKLAREMAAGT